jgi:hypothetical protein
MDVQQQQELQQHHPERRVSQAPTAKEIFRDSKTLCFAGSNSELQHITLSPAGLQKLLTFRYSVEYTLWECCSKLVVLRNFVESTDNVKKVLALAQSINNVKKVNMLL